MEKMGMDKGKRWCTPPDC